MDLFSAFWTFLTFIFLIIDLVLAMGLIYLFIKCKWFIPKLSLTSVPAQGLMAHRAELKEKWEKILQKTSGNSIDSMRLAIIEADQLVDSVLKDSGLEGEHMADRLEQLSPEEARSVNRLWRAHRVRNDIVHSPDFELSFSVAEHTLEAYGEFLKELNIL